MSKRMLAIYLRKIVKVRIPLDSKEYFFELKAQTLLTTMINR